jgi:gliding motility-associated-like protein
LYALTQEGCDKTTKILIKRFKGPEIYIPTAFTPNGDQRNDSLKVFPVGIKSFGHFTVFNRFGNVVFTTTDFTKGWDGKQNGKLSDSGTYIAVAEAVDYLGKPMIKREIVLLIQ